MLKTATKWIPKSPKMLSIINNTMLSDIDIYISVFIGYNILNKKKSRAVKNRRMQSKIQRTWS